MEQLQPYGWNDFFAEKLQGEFAEFAPARVTADFGSTLKLVMPQEVTATLSGSLKHLSDPASAPKVGDWVAVQKTSETTAIIEAVLPRQSEIARRAAGGKAQKQVMAANVDVAFVIQSLNSDFSPERLQRYLYQLSASNVQPILVLNKADQVDDPTSFIARVQPLGVPYILCSATTGQGVDDILARILPGKTAVLVGSSGVGKSTLTNRLLGRDAQKTQEIRQRDATGRHTTIHRELFVLPGGGLLIDTPGIRELQLWGTQEELQSSFGDVIALLGKCEYANCSHGKNERGCAVQAALTSGELSKDHYDNYLKMAGELELLDAKTTRQTERRNKRPVHKKQSRQAQKRSIDDY